MNINKPALISLFFAFSLFCATGALAAGSNSAANNRIAMATSFVTSMAAGNFTAAQANFTDKLKNKFTPEKLKSKWDHMVAKSGDYLKTGATKTMRRHGYNIVVVTTEFKKGSWRVAVAFDKSNKAAILRFKD